jgi:hypothetical protein
LTFAAAFEDEVATFEAPTTALLVDSIVAPYLLYKGNFLRSLRGDKPSLDLGGLGLQCDETSSGGIAVET